MSKLFISAVSCANPDAHDIPECFVTVINDQLLMRIKTLAEQVAQLGVFAVEEFNHGGSGTTLQLM